MEENEDELLEIPRRIRDVNRKLMRTGEYIRQSHIKNNGGNYPLSYINLF